MENLGINGPLLVFQIIHFVLFVWILNLLLFRPIGNMFERRKQRIADSLAEADRVKQQAAEERQELEQKIAEERREAQVALTKAHKASEEAAERRLAEANAEAEQIVAQAREDAAERRSQALSGLQGEIADLAMAAASKVVASAIDQQKHRELVDRFIKEELGEMA